MTIERKNMTTLTKSPVDREQLLADLAWEFCEKNRSGDNASMEEFLERCPDEATRTSFRDLVNTDLLLHAVVENQQL